MDTVSRAAEKVARLSYAKLLAILSARWGDLAAAEDALSAALERALLTWPKDGVPQNPEGWILTVARRAIVDGSRSNASRRRAIEGLAILEEERAAWAQGDTPDEVLTLLFACANPAVDESMRAPFMLQVVLGLDARRIASAFLVPPATMSQRLTRLRTRLRDQEAQFELPDQEVGPVGAESVLDAIYAAYNIGWEMGPDSDSKVHTLSEEAIWLGSLVVRLMPDDPEALGLLALMLYSQARRPARRRNGQFVPLADQSSDLWILDMINDAERLLSRASEFGVLGRYQIEAAIQSIHSARSRGMETDWRNIALLYHGLCSIAPTLGAQVGYATALAEIEGPLAGLDALDAAESPRKTGYQPYWAVRAHLLAQSGDIEGARDAYLTAAGLTEDPAVRKFLLKRANRLLS